MSDTNLLDSLKNSFKFQKADFAPWIEYIRFPKYKALEKNLQIEFTFPITILVGKNGVNKTSILHALYGVPGNKSVGQYWFSTDIDKIDTIDSGKESKQCMIYSYYHDKAGRVVEVLKTRVNTKNNLDYWEPARPQKQYDMTDYDQKDFKALGSQYSTRWENLEKNVIFCDNKEYVSAYDLLFYHSTYKGSKSIKSRQEFIRFRSRPLGNYISRNLEELNYKGRNRLLEDRLLSDVVVKEISKIMDEEYEYIRIIKHSLYTNLQKNDCMIRPAETILLKKKGLQYSEAFAGSGESRLILLVDKITSAESNSLVLIDEPEISLHPEAIYRFRDFLIATTLKLKLQVVVTTHSIHFIEGFPPEAIKLLERIENTVSISDSVDYRSAFYSIGASIDSKLIVFVEDELVKYLLDYYIKKTDNNILHNNVEIRVHPGGAESIINNWVKLGGICGLKKYLILLDGDKFKSIENSRYLKNEYFADGVIDSDRIPVSENHNLKDIIKDLTGVSFKNLPINGNHDSDNNDELYNAYRAIITYWSKYVIFLGKDKTPETLLKEAINYEGEGIEKEGKDFFKDQTQRLLNCDVVTAEQIFHQQQLSVPRISDTSELKLEINRILDVIKEHI